MGKNEWPWRLGQRRPLVGQDVTDKGGHLPTLLYFSKMASSRAKVSANSSITSTQSATASRRGWDIASSQKSHAYRDKDGTPILDCLSKFPRYQRAHVPRPGWKRQSLGQTLGLNRLFDLGTAIV